MGNYEKATLPKGGVDPGGAVSLVGEKLDNRYVILKVIGEGGMGVVYEAVHEALDKRVAVKVLRPEVSRDEKTVARFKREARSASAIGSPHICDVSDFGALADGSTYFVMEMLDGPSLTKAMSPGFPMDPPRLLAIGSQLCEALGAAHARGIVHRDLKPDNVHLVKQGSTEEFVKVLDFGIAKVQDTGETKLTQAGQVFGTPHYMSPEQCAGHEVDHRTDIYALGVMLYEMATGRVPFDADNLMGLLTKHVYEQPIPPRELPTPIELPPGLDAVILKCMAKQPASRYQQMVELKADLDALLAGETPSAVLGEIDRSLPAIPKTAYQSVAPGAMPTEPPAEPRRGALYLVAGGALGLVALGVFAFVAFGPSGEVDPPPPIADDPAPSDPIEDPAPAPVARGAVEAPPGEPSAEASMVHLVTEPPGAEVMGPDGALVGNTPVDVAKPGDGDEPIGYSVRLAGYEHRMFTVGAGTQDEVTLTLARERAARRRRRRSTETETTSPTGMDATQQTDTVVSPTHGDLHDPFAEGGEASMGMR